jgi:hypothetical protein
MCKYVCELIKPPECARTAAVRTHLDRRRRRLQRSRRLLITRFYASDDKY